MEEKNAIIKSTFLGVEDHGILTFWLSLDFGSSGQGFGGWALDEWREKANRRIGTPFGTESILRLLEVIGVESWEKLEGRVCRVRGSREAISAIGHFIEDKWFSPAELAKEMGL